MKKSLALDISDYSIEAVLVSGDDKKIKVKSFSRILLEKGIISRGEVQDNTKLKAAIKKLLSEAKSKIKIRDVIIGLPDSRVFTHIFQVPLSLRGEEIRGAIENELESVFPLTASEIYWDYKIISIKNEIQDVFVAAISKNIVDSLNKACVDAGLKPVVFDLEANGLARVLLSEDKKESNLLLDIGANSTKISFFNNFGINFMSVVDVAGDDFTQKIMTKLKVTAAQAEKLKKTGGLKKGSKIASIIEPSLKELVRELKRVIEFCESKSEGKIQNIVCSGGTAMMPELIPYLKKALGMNIEIGKLNDKLNIKEKEINNPIYYSAIGLARRGLLKNFEEADTNLIPRKFRAKKKVKKFSLPKPSISKPNILNKINHESTKEKKTAKENREREKRLKKYEKEENGGMSTREKFNLRRRIEIIVLIVGIVGLGLFAGFKYKDSIVEFVNRDDGLKEGSLEITSTGTEELGEIVATTFSDSEYSLTVDVSGVESKKQGMIKGELVEVGVDGEKIFDTLEMSNKTGEPDDRLNRVTQLNIDQGKQDLIDELIFSDIDNIEKDHDNQLIIPQIIDYNITVSSSTVAPDTESPEFEIHLEAKPVLLAIPEEEAVNAINEGLAEGKIEELNTDFLSFEIDSYNRIKGLISLSIVQK
ncbi:MAG: type IV pilus assembly protein PilM [Patescibacteria group bacterium]